MLFRDPSLAPVLGGGVRAHEDATRQANSGYHTHVGHYQQPSSDDHDDRPGCLDALAITRALFGILIWPVGIMLVVIFDVSITFYLYVTNPWLALIPIALSVGGFGAFIRRERERLPPPEDP